MAAKGDDRHRPGWAPRSAIAMTSLSIETGATGRRTPAWYWAAAAAGVAWNLYGIKQFIGSVTASADHLRTMGMTLEQAELYAALPLWMHAAFALGVFGGLVGCGLLLLRDQRAVPVFAASLIGYLVLYAGDIALGVFAAFGASQVIILTIVVAIAVGLLLLARRARRDGLVR
jgi:hypothetical protein